MVAARGAAACACVAGMGMACLPVSFSYVIWYQTCFRRYPLLFFLSEPRGVGLWQLELQSVNDVFFFGKGDPFLPQLTLRNSKIIKL